VRERREDLHAVEANASQHIAGANLNGFDKQSIKVAMESLQRLKFFKRNYLFKIILFENPLLLRPASFGIAIDDFSTNLQEISYCK
jgi:hypothetical protein